MSDGNPFKAIAQAARARGFQMDASYNPEADALSLTIWKGKHQVKRLVPCPLGSQEVARTVAAAMDEIEPPEPVVDPYWAEAAW